MILEILVSSTPTDKTFFYKECSCKTDQTVVGQLVKVKFRNKSQVGLICFSDIKELFINSKKYGKGEITFFIF